MNGRKEGEKRRRGDSLVALARRDSDLLEEICRIVRKVQPDSDLPSEGHTRNLRPPKLCARETIPIAGPRRQFLLELVRLHN